MAIGNLYMSGSTIITNPSIVQANTPAYRVFSLIFFSLGFEFLMEEWGDFIVYFFAILYTKPTRQ